MTGRIVARSDIGVLRLTIDNPERANALSPRMAAAFREELRITETEPGIQVVVLQGRGSRAFCSGFDLDHAEGETGVRDLAPLMDALRDCPVPTVAVLNGHALGAGLELACRCDIRLARTGARVGLPAVRLGVAYRLTGLEAILTTSDWLRPLLLNGRQEAVDDLPGFADQVCPPEDLSSVVDQWVADLTAAAPRAMEYTVHALRLLRGRRDDDARELEMQRRRIMQGPDLDEAIAARRQSRSPRFQPRVIADDSHEREQEEDR